MKRLNGNLNKYVWVPQVFVTIILALLVFIFVGRSKDVTQNQMAIQELEPRMRVAETQVENIEDAIVDIKEGQKEIQTDIKILLQR